MTNFVLVHGSYQGGWIWQHVAARLRAGGTHGVRADARWLRRAAASVARRTSTPRRYGTEIAELLFYEDLRDVVLVGTSSGGMVVCRAAEQMRDRVGRLVLVDALALFNGERTRDIVNRSAPGAVRPGRRTVAGGRGERACSPISTRRRGNGRSIAIRRIRSDAR